MQDSEISEELVFALQRPDGDKALRPVHTIGISATGFFEPSPIAKNFCIAKHFDTEKTDVIVRFSNGSGCAVVHDGWSDVRGMAVRFHLPDGTDTDLISMTLPEFFAPTPETFLEFAEMAAPKPYKGQTPWQKIAGLLKLILPERDPYPGETISPDEGALQFADEHEYAQLSVLQASQIGAPVSYVRAAYHAVHTFIVTAPDGTRRWVRFSWQPIAGVLNTDPNATPDDDYLRQELRDRLANETARFSLMMTIGEVGDDFNDSTRSWPPHRKRIMMGTLTVDAIPEDQIADNEKLSFNPGLLTDGIAFSDDPVLHVRLKTYEFSSKLREATPCPFSKR
ncbi:catalase [Yoonia sp. BS5-3]|uniref:catalase n=1 Tax=Yoonia phaeophyticola TaxID=3137369 RepID=A0ABZ2VAB9_9RHOB